MDRLPRAARAITRLLHEVQARLLFPFVDVVCIFADDIGGIAATDDLVNRWLENRPLVEGGPKPGLLVFSHASRDEFKGKSHQFEDKSHQRLECSPRFKAHFVSVKYVCLSDPAQLSHLAIHQFLRDTIFQETDLARLARSAYRFLFSAAHLNPFFEAALEHFNRDYVYSFIFMDVAQRQDCGHFVPEEKYVLLGSKIEFMGISLSWCKCSYIGERRR